MEIGLPSESGRLQIFKIHTAKMKSNGKLGADVNLEVTNLTCLLTTQNIRRYTIYNISIGKYMLLFDTFAISIWNLQLLYANNYNNSLVLHRYILCICIYLYML